MSETECIPKQLEFEGLGVRRVVAEFSGEEVTSDAGGLLLREVERASGIIRRFSECFDDYRAERFIEHTVEQLLAQRIYGLALGYEDLNDHDSLRRDRLLAVLVGKVDPTGSDRKRDQDRGVPLAGKSTLNRLELTKPGGARTDRYRRIECNPQAVGKFFVDSFLDAYAEPPDEIVLDLDATDDPLHGSQEGRFFHGYYGCYCYLPLYIFCDDHLVLAKLRPSNVDAAAGSLKEVMRIVHRIRRRWPDVRIILRGDSGFCRDYLMTWCERRGVDYIFGLAKNQRLIREISRELEKGRRRFIKSGVRSRRFKDFCYQTRTSWTRPRRVVGKAEYLPKGSNPRFVVTSIPASEYSARDLYEKLYCARGDMENRIKEQQLGLFADRTSSSIFFSNQIRLWLSSVAYVLMSTLRRIGLQGTELARAQCSTIRTRLLKLGATLTVSVRRVLIRLPKSSPIAQLFAQILAALQRAGPQTI